MARRGSKKGSSSGGIIMMLLLAISAMMVLGTLAAVGYWIYMKVVRGDHLARRNSFDRTEDEEQRYQQALNDLGDVEREIHALLKEGAHLKRRNDGLFYANTKLGKELNARLLHLEPIHSELEGTVTALGRIPGQRKDDWVSKETYFQLVEKGLLIFLCLSLCFVIYMPDFLKDITAATNLLISGFVGDRLASAMGLAFWLTFAYSFFAHSKKKQEVIADLDRPELKETLSAPSTSPILDLTFKLLGGLVSADGTVSRSEVDTVKAFIRSIELNPEQVKAAVASFQAGVKNASGFKESAIAFAAQVKDLDNPDFVTTILAALCEVSAADGEVADVELEYLIFLSNQLEVSEQELESIYQPYIGTTELEKSLDLLDCKPGMSEEQLSTAYQDAKKKYDFELGRGRAIAPEILQIASHKMKEVEKAYQIVKSNLSGAVAQKMGQKGQPEGEA